jgi:F420-dependent methylenetetrahydromethanopterin dehydrogenase
MSVDVARAQYDFGSASASPKKCPRSNSNLTHPVGTVGPGLIQQRVSDEAQAIPALENAVEVRCECSVELLKASYLENSKKENRILEPFDSDFSAFLGANPAAPGDSWRSCHFKKIHHLC